MKNIYFLAIFSVNFALCFAEKVRFDNHQVWSVNISNTDQLKVLQTIDENDGYSFWRPPRFIGEHLEIVVAPKKLNDFQKIVEDYKFENKLVIPDLQRAIDNEQPPKKCNVKRNSQHTRCARQPYRWTHYQTLDELYAWLNNTISANPDVSKPLVMGYSSEGRPIRGIHINYGKNEVEKRAIFIESNIHARERITIPTATWIINQLLTSNDTDVRFVAENFEWFIFPTVNPDGYVYTHTDIRMWRKSRSNSSATDSKCYGVDLNRNFDFSWMEEGSSQDPCSDRYAGPEPFSEPESRAIRDFIETIKEKLEMYLAFHSYTQLILYPFGAPTKKLNNEKDHIRLAQAAVKAIKEVNGTRYEAIKSQNLYKVTGTSADWVKGQHNIPFSFVYEMRDLGEYGFVLPASQIIPNAKEVLHSIIAMIKEGMKLKYFPIVKNTNNTI